METAAQYCVGGAITNYNFTDLKIPALKMVK